MARLIRKISRGKLQAGDGFSAHPSGSFCRLVGGRHR